MTYDTEIAKENPFFNPVFTHVDIIYNSIILWHKYIDILCLKVE